MDNGRGRRWSNVGFPEIQFGVLLGLGSRFGFGVGLRFGFGFPAGNHSCAEGSGPAGITITPRNLVSLAPHHGRGGTSRTPPAQRPLCPAQGPLCPAQSQGCIPPAGLLPQENFSPITLSRMHAILPRSEPDLPAKANESPSFPPMAHHAKSILLKLPHRPGKPF